LVAEAELWSQRSPEGAIEEQKNPNVRVGAAIEGAGIDAQDRDEPLERLGDSAFQGSVGRRLRRVSSVPFLV
jgi:hypothetical protein